MADARPLPGLRRRNALGRGQRAAALAILSLHFAPIDAVAAEGRRDAPPLLPMSRDDLTRAHVRGTGCSFLVGARRSVLLSMTESRAAVRLRGGVVTLGPVPGSPALFPGTFASWRSGGLTVHVRELAGDALVDGEGVETPATMEVSANGRRWRMRGRLDCGS